MQHAVIDRLKSTAKWVSPLTWCCAVAVIVIAFLLSAPMHGLKGALIIIAGPLAFLGSITGIEGYLPAGSDWVRTVGWAAAVSLPCMAFILAHSMKRHPITALLTIIGFIAWLIFGMSVAFVGV